MGRVSTVAMHVMTMLITVMDKHNERYSHVHTMYSIVSDNIE